MPEPYRPGIFDQPEAKFDLMGGISRAADVFAELGENTAGRRMHVP